MNDIATPETCRCPERRRSVDAAMIAIILALTAVMVWQRWVWDNWLARHDLFTFFLPWMGALGDRLREGDIPALNRYLFSGAPFAGDPESGWMYLPAMLVFPFFDLITAYKVFITLLLVIGGVTTYLLARVIGYRPLAALFTAVSFAFGPYLFGQTDCCTVGVNLLAFMPLAFLGVELALWADSWPRRLAAWVIGGFAISQMFAAWMGQGVANALIIVAAWVVFRTLITPRDETWDLRTRFVQMVTTGPAVLILGLLMGAAGILPRLAANAESNNAGGTYENTPGSRDGSFHTLASALKTLMVDNFAFRGSSVWGTVFLLVVMSVFVMRRRSVIPFFLAIVLLIPAIAMNVPVITDALYLIPLYKDMQIHSPGRVFWVNPFFPAMLAGAVVNELWRFRAMAWRWVFPPAALLITWLAARHVQSVEHIAVGGWFWAGAIITAIVLLLVTVVPREWAPPRQQRAVQAAMVALVVLTFVLPNGVDIANTLRAPDPPPGTLDMHGNDAWMQDLIAEALATSDPGGAGEFLQHQRDTSGPFRFIAYGGIGHPGTVYRSYPDRRLEPNLIDTLANMRPMRLQLETTQGYDPLQPLVYQEFIAALNGEPQDYHYANLHNTGVDSPLLDLLNVRYIVVDRTIPEDRDDIVALKQGRTEVFRNEHVIIFERRSAANRAWMVYDVRPEDETSLSQLANGGVNGLVTAFVDGSVPPVDQPTSQVPPQITLMHYANDSETFQVNQTGSGLLVVSEIWSENWKATVDGKDVDVLRTDHALLGIPVGAGEHTVELRYAPTSLRLGVWISAVTGIAGTAVLAWAGWDYVRRR